MTRSTHLVRSAAATAAAGLVLAVLVAQPAHAATFNVTTLEELRAALVGCTGANVVVFDADITQPAEDFEPLVIPCDIALELNGHILTVGGITTDDGVTLHIDDDSAAATGSLTTVNLQGGAGLEVGSSSALIIDGGEIVAAGYSYGAGIGSNPFDAAGTITINGGDVHAMGGGNHAAGIGGGFFGSGATLTVTGGSVDAVGSGDVPGIGAGGNAAPGTTLITGGTVVMSGTAEPQFALMVGSLTVSGTGILSVPTGFIGTSSDQGIGLSIGAGGRLVGVIGDETAGGTVVGDLAVQNSGVIGLDAALVQVPVDGNDFVVDFDPQNGDPVASVHLFAPDFATGYRSIPAAPAGTDWNTAANGSGTWFTADSPVTGDLTLFAATPPGSDGDGDGVADSADVCEDSDLTGGSVTRPKGTKPNHYWWTGEVLTNGATSYTLAQTGGCTATDIIAAAALGKGHAKSGISPSAMTAWLASLE